MLDTPSPFFKKRKTFSIKKKYDVTYPSPFWSFSLAKQFGKICTGNDFQNCANLRFLLCKAQYLWVGHHGILAPISTTPNCLSSSSIPSFLSYTYN
jgi:hypothetical protein